MSVALAKPGIDWVEVQDLVSRQLAKDHSQEEIAAFLVVARRLELDPLARHIYSVKREGKATVQVSIDGFRLIAQRSGRYQGQTRAEWYHQKSSRWGEVWLSESPPDAARVGVYAAGFVEPLVRVATWQENAKTDKNGNLTRPWRDMPALMLAKCAESQALRAAFPQELGGVYTDAELPSDTQPDDIYVASIDETDEYEASHEPLESADDPPPMSPGGLRLPAGTPAADATAAGQNR